MFQIKQLWTDHSDQLQACLWIGVRIIILFIIARLALFVFNRLMRKALHYKGKMDARRRDTLDSLFNNVAKYSIYFILVLTILPMFGIHIGALLAGAGVAGIAIAFGAQSLIKDFFNGFFIIFEDQYGVGDFVRINNVEGQVYFIGLRMTQVRIWTGEVEMIPNGQINQVTNFSKFNSIAVIEIDVGYNTREETAIKIIEGVMVRLAAEMEEIIGDVEVLGVQALGNSSYTIRAIAECAPYEHWGVEREAKKRIRTALSDAGADLPLQKIVYMHAQSGREQEHEH